MDLVRTKQSLLQALQRAATIEQTAAQIHQQRISYIMSVVGKDSGITKDRVEAVLDRQEGKTD